MTDSSISPLPESQPIPLSSSISAGIRLVEAAIEFFLVVEGGKYAELTHVLQAFLKVSRIL